MKHFTLFKMHYAQNSSVLTHNIPFLLGYLEQF